MTSALFTKINESFKCYQCGFQVPPSTSTCRDHCPKCLYSLHLDVHPGDRMSQCHGVLKPISYKTHSKKGYQIQYVCLKCGENKANKFLSYDRNCPDDYSSLLSLSGVSS